MIIKTKDFQDAANKILLAAGLDQNAANLEVVAKESNLYLNVTHFIGLFILAVHAAWGNLSSKQRLNPCPLQQKHGVLTTRPPGKAPGRSLKPFICTCGSQVWSSGQQHHLLFGLHSFNKVWVFPP